MGVEGERDKELILAWKRRRWERVARNERDFKLHNRRREQIEQGAVGEDDLVPFVCECGDRECAQAVEMTIAEIDMTHAGPDRYAVKPGHVIPEFEEITGQHDRYWEVRKFQPSELRVETPAL
jgi:hypothetical protein